MNSKRGGVTLKNGDEEITVRISTNAMVRYQDHAGEPFLTGISALQENQTDVRRVRDLFWAGVSHIEGMTPEMAGDLMDDVGFAVAFEKVCEATAIAFPSEEKVPAGNVKAGKSVKAEKAPATT
tara:strand:- start:9 stop:380 length:372 start_codon:yes stop_codon:yes gene_type:complete